MQWLLVGPGPPCAGPLGWGGGHLPASGTGSQGTTTSYQRSRRGTDWNSLPGHLLPATSLLFGSPRFRQIQPGQRPHTTKFRPFSDKVPSPLCLAIPCPFLSDLLSNFKEGRLLETHLQPTVAEPLQPSPRFRLKTLPLILNWLAPALWACSVDLHGAYLHVPVFVDHCSFLMFH